MINLKLSGVKELKEALRDLKLPEKETMAMVKKASNPLKEEIIINYRAAGHYNEKRESGLHLVDTINQFKRVRKGNTDPYFTYYVGPKFTTGKNRGQGQGGQQSVFIEWGTAYRSRANTSKGGVSLGKSRQYGSKISTGRVFKEGKPTVGIIRKSMDKTEQNIVSILKKNVVDLLIKEWNK